MRTTAVKLVLLGTALLAPASARGQTASAFDKATLEVTSEWVGQDRGDGSGSYRLTTRVTDGQAGWTIEHELAAERAPDLALTSTESLKVLQGDQEMASAESDPAALGQWADPAVAYAIPFDVEFNTDPRKSYRPRQRQVEELVHSAAPEARVSTRSASDGRTSATVEIPGVLPVAELARQFVGIRQALRDADVGLAKLQIKGQADTSASAEAASAQ
ncbi:MAG TPA: hypothetical protein VJ788_02275 [Gemmatimonadota bacterium]|nr:hypothetical protein [Gemmatimonadota bacterium]